MKKIERDVVHRIEEHLERIPQLIQVLVGPRQSGKTTAARKVLERWPGPKRYAAADLPRPPGPEWIQSEWQLARNAARNGPTLLVLDEVQKVAGWSETVKAMWDEEERELRDDLEVWEGGRMLLRKCRAEAVLITRGEEGMTLVERRRPACFHVPALARQVFDVTGAGDTVIGTLAACLAAGASMREAAVMANVAASVVVGEVGTAPITAEKLLHALRAQEREREAESQEGIAAPRPRGGTGR